MSFDASQYPQDRQVSEDPEHDLSYQPLEEQDPGPVEDPTSQSTSQPNSLPPAKRGSPLLSLNAAIPSRTSAAGPSRGVTPYPSTDDIPSSASTSSGFNEATLSSSSSVSSIPAKRPRSSSSQDPFCVSQVPWKRVRHCCKCGGQDCKGKGGRNFCHRPCRDCGNPKCRGRNSRKPDRLCSEGWS